MPEIVNVSIVCDCGCGTVIAADAPRFVVEGWEILGSSAHGRGSRAIFVGPSHVASMATLLASRYGDPLPPVSGTPDEYLVAHFAVQDMTDADIAAKWSDPARDSAWTRALTEESIRRGWYAYPDGTYAQTPPRAPGTPTGLTVSNNAGSVTASWTAPTDAGTSPITHYTIFLGPHLGSVDTSDATHTFTLTAGTYDISVAAVSAVGTSAASTSIPLTVS